MSAETALREALMDIAEGTHDAEAWDGWREVQRLRDIAKTALEDAALASPESRSLDVETLAEAMWFEGLIEGSPNETKAREAAESLLSAYAGVAMHRAARLREHSEGPR